MPGRPPEPFGAEPAREGWPLALLACAALTALAVVAVVLSGGFTGATTVRRAAVAPPPVTVAVAVPAASPAPAPAVASAPAPKPVERRRDEVRFALNDRSHVPAGWVAAYYPLYAEAQRVFGVNWLLIASVHKQETAFSTSRGIYRGLNFARCCAGPMQFNVTNGHVSTWDRFGGAFRDGRRPAAYNHRTARHPSVYDDFDAIMAAGSLLRSSGAGLALDASAWRAAYDYYGHDLTGVDYANSVLARAIGWGRSGFCINCALDPSLLGAVDAAWGAPVRAELAPPKAPGEPKALAARHRR